jgi:hypothetical protein
MATRPEKLSIPEKAPTPMTMPENVGQGRPKQERFQLQVDRQTKATYTTMEAAETAGRAIKKAHPICQVAIYDATASANTLIEAS